MDDEERYQIIERLERLSRCKEERVIDLVQNKLIELNDVELSYRFCILFSEFKSLNIKEHEKIVLDSKNPWYNYLFAKNIKGADILAHGKVIIDSKNPWYNYMFAKNIKGSDIFLHCQVIIDNMPLKHSNNKTKSKNK